MAFSKQNVDENTDYKAGHAISLEDRTISVKFDSTLCLNSEGKLSCVSSGSSGGGGIDYSEGEEIHINNHKISANVNGTTIKFNDQNQLTAIGGGAEYSAGNALVLDGNKFNVNVDGSSIKINQNNQLESISSGKTYTAGDGIDITIPSPAV